MGESLFGRGSRGSPAPPPTAKSPISEITIAEINNPPPPPPGAPRKPRFPFLRDQVDQLFGPAITSYVNFVIIIARPYLTRLNVILYYWSKLPRPGASYFFPGEYSLSKLAMSVEFLVHVYTRAVSPGRIMTRIPIRNIRSLSFYLSSHRLRLRYDYSVGRRGRDKKSNVFFFSRFYDQSLALSLLLAAPSPLFLIQ